MNQAHRLPLRWVWARQWHQGQLSIWLGRLAVMAASVWLCVAVVWQQQQRAVLAQQAAPVLPEAEPVAVARPINAEPGDFAQGFQPDRGIAVWMGDFQHAAARSGVRLLAVADTPRAAQVGELGRHDVLVTLRGAYPQIKLLMKETLDRHPSTTVARLSLRSLADTSDVEATVAWVRWSRPEAAAAQASAVRP